MKILKFKQFESKEIEKDNITFFQEYDQKSKSMVAVYLLKEITDDSIILFNRQEWLPKNLWTFEVTPRRVAKYKEHEIVLPKDKVEVLEKLDNEYVKVSIPYYIWKKHKNKLSIRKLEDDDLQWRRD